MPDKPISPHLRLCGLGEHRYARSFSDLPCDPEYRIGCRLGVSFIDSTFSIYGDGNGLRFLAKHLKEWLDEWVEDWIPGRGDDPSIDLDEMPVGNVNQNIEVVVDTDRFGEIPKCRGIVGVSSDCPTLGFQIAEIQPGVFDVRLDDEYSSFLHFTCGRELMKDVVGSIESVATSIGESSVQTSGEFTLSIRNTPDFPEQVSECVVVELEEYRLETRNEASDDSVEPLLLHFKKGGRKQESGENDDILVDVPNFYSLWGTSEGYRNFARAMLQVEPRKGSYLVFDAKTKQFQRGESGYPIEDCSEEDRDPCLLVLELTEEGDWCGQSIDPFILRFSNQWLSHPEEARVELLESGADALVLKLNWEAWLTKISWFCWLDFRNDHVECEKGYAAEFALDMEYGALALCEDAHLKDPPPLNLRIGLWPEEYGWDKKGRPIFEPPPTP